MKPYNSHYDRVAVPSIVHILFLIAVMGLIYEQICLQKKPFLDNIQKFHYVVFHSTLLNILDNSDHAYTYKCPMCAPSNRKLHHEWHKEKKSAHEGNYHSPPYPSDISWTKEATRA